MGGRKSALFNDAALRGELVLLLSDWSEERYPLYAYHASRHLPPAKVRAFLDFVQDVAAAPGAGLAV